MRLTGKMWYESLRLAILLQQGLSVKLVGHWQYVKAMTKLIEEHGVSIDKLTFKITEKPK